MSQNEKIFVQIASYRDPELLPTIRDCIKKAEKPENLVFSIAWQHSEEDEWDTLEEYVNDDRFRIIDIPHEDSKGTCWARNLTQSKYDNEQYTMQLDSHHRFVRNWDKKCKQMMDDLQTSGVKKPLLTAYLPSYNPQNDPAERVKEVWRLTFDRFTPEGVIFMLPSTLEDWQNEPLPTSTRFFSAHFLFTFGQWNLEVPYDPDLYFHGEEISLAVRSFTCGYDLFIPNQIVAWHEYTREGRVRHWDENKIWKQLNDNSLLKVKKLLNVDGARDDTDFGIYGLGTERTQEEYEQFSGIRFKDRAVQKYTLDHFESPNPTYHSARSYEKSFVNRFRHCIDVFKTDIDETIDWDAWAVIFEEEDGTPIDRHDFDKDGIRNIKENYGKNDWYNIWREFDYKGVPYKWVVWPYSNEHGWGRKLEGILPQIK